MFGSCRVVRFICLSNKNWKRDKSESEAWKIGAEISAVPSVSVLRRVIPFLFLAVAGESILLRLVSQLIGQVQGFSGCRIKRSRIHQRQRSSQYSEVAFKDSVAVPLGQALLPGIQAESTINYLFILGCVTINQCCSVVTLYNPGVLIHSYSLSAQFCAV